MFNLALKITELINDLSKYFFRQTAAIRRCEVTLLCSYKNRRTKGYKEKQDLVVLQGAAQPHQSNQEQEDANADDPSHHADAGDQAEPFPPGCHSNQQQTHQLSRKETKRWENQRLMKSQPQGQAAGCHGGPVPKTSWLKMWRGGYMAAHHWCSRILSVGPLSSP